MRSRTTRRMMRSLIGDPKRVVKDLRRFRRSTRALSSDHPRLIDKYEKDWVAIYGGKVRARARSFEHLMADIDRKQLPRGDVVVRFIDKDERIMIL